MLDRLDQLAEQPRHGQAGHRGQPRAGPARRPSSRGCRRIRARAYRRTWADVGDRQLRRSLGPPRGSRRRRIAPDVSSSSRWVPSATTRPPRRRPRGRPGRARAGWWCRRPWCARAEHARRRAAMRASVWASTALVGSTSTRTGGSASSARASRSRCCCPPENSRPRSATIVSSPSGSASTMSSALAACSAARIRSARRTRGRVQLVAQAAGEQPGVVVGHEDPLAHPSRGRSRSGTPSRRGPAVGVAAQPVGDGDGVLGSGGRDGGEQAGADHARPSRGRPDWPWPGRGRPPASPGRRAPGSGDSTRTTRRAATWPRVSFSTRLGERPQREDQERGVPVEGDELRHGDRAGHAPPARPARSPGPRRCRAAGSARRPAATRPAPPGHPRPVPAGTRPGSGRRTSTRRRRRAAPAGR